MFRTKQRKRDNIDETVSLEYSLGIIDENVRTKTKPFAHWWCPGIGEMEWIKIISTGDNHTQQYYTLSAKPR